MLGDVSSVAHRPMLARATALGAAVTTLTLIPHTAASGVLPDPLAIATVFIVCAALSATIHRSAAIVHTILVLAGLQVLGHALLTTIGAHGASHAADSLLPSLSMICFHAAGAIIATLVVIRADSIAMRWRALVEPLVSPVLSPQCPDVPAITASSPWEMVRGRRSACVGVEAGRAPPAHL